MTAPRRTSEWNIYHVINRGDGKKVIFEDSEDNMCFLDKIQEAFEACNVSLLSWCLMSNHFHLLVHGSMEAVSRAMQWAQGDYAKIFNARHGHVGHVFQRRFKSEPVHSEAYLATVVRYIHANPVQAHLCATCADYPWSSYREYVPGPMLSGYCKTLCATGLVKSAFGSLADFEQFHAQKSRPDECMDIDADRPEATRMTDDEARKRAEHLLGQVNLGNLAQLPKPERDAAVALLKADGISSRQIQRLTGIGLKLIRNAGT
ncbi:MAG: transposase [Coriobacteriia bacterium]|nr:transposase [Coriobacteriia bacterium]